MAVERGFVQTKIRAEQCRRQPGFQQGPARGDVAIVGTPTQEILAMAGNLNKVMLIGNLTRDDSATDIGFIQQGRIRYRFD